MSTELLPAKTQGRASSPCAFPFALTAPNYAAANMLHAFAERLQMNSPARASCFHLPSNSGWMYSSNFACDNHPYADDILAVLETRLITCTSKTWKHSTNYWNAPTAARWRKIATCTSA